ncbi:hypothetical protein ACFLTP_04680 [Chloroflexota bacterium]
MSDYREQALVAITALVVGGDNSLTDDDFSIFGRNPEEAEEYSKRLSEIYDAMFRSFFHFAAEGLGLIPENRVTEKFGRPIKDNYHEASEPFLKFAVTYWTLRVLTYDSMENDMEWIGVHLLAKLEQDIGPVFFTFPGQVKIAPSMREKTQREFIQRSGANIDIERFMKGNPILICDRSSKRGCLGVALLFCSLIIIIGCFSILLF